MIEVRYERGIYLPAQDLWFDPREAKRFAFISHAHGDHIAPHEEIILSERTARLLQARMPGTRIEHVLPFGEQRRVHDADVTLLPAGHIFGSAQLFLSSGNETLLYTGDFKLRHGKSAEAAEWREADTLIMETTFGLPRYQFPRTEQVIEQIVAFCRETIEDGASTGTPGLFVRQSAGNLVFTRWRGTYADAAWFGLSNDADLRAIRAIVLQIRPLQQK
jgi:DNA ligase-1